MRRERRRRASRRAHHVLDLLHELEHRRAGPHLRRDGGHRRVAHRAGALHHLELLGRLRPPELVHEPRARHRPRRAQRVGQLEHRLGPRAVADPRACRVSPRPRAPRRRAPGRRRARSRRRASPAARPAISNSVIIRGRTKTGSAPGRKNAPRPSRARTATRRSSGSRARRRSGTRGRRGRQEEDVDAGLPDPLAQPPLPLRVVEHRGESRRAPMSDMRLFDLRVTVERIEGRSVCGLAPGDYFELTESSRVRIPAGSTSASTRSPPCCRSCPRSSGSSRRGLAGDRDVRRLPGCRGAADHADRADRRAEDAR